ncbi:MAG TPA: ABC transporter permease [Planctomycetota bacterium]|nr:ABC transporter permease [Planctomycetota bacterium]
MFSAIVKAQHWFETACAGAGYTLDLLVRAAGQLVYLGRKRREAFDQLALCTLGSLSVVFITALFTGMIVSLQTGQVLRDFGQESSLGYIVTLGMCREMGPVFTCLSLAGLVGSTYAAEIGTMKVSEEVDALEVMSIDPVYYLVMPRLLALGIAAVALTIYADVIGIAGGALVARANFDVDLEIFIKNGRDSLKMKDIYGGLFKSFLFGMTIGTVACAQGLRAEGGPAGVGRATLHSVVISFMLILVIDYLVTWLIW